ncbi:reverse transcriptase [Plakobranchus ocellatus]|uniref:Reverse transcriptase n=1 Tax=Plakobranchus ocellatus TaxID=259542 RepID=A0AAV4C9H0_9GAST|nr:reverse transcriptase [Plakobranchus ocellatus]
MKEVIGQTQTDRRGLGSTTAKWWSKTEGKEKRDMIIDEIKNKEDSTWKGKKDDPTCPLCQSRQTTEHVWSSCKVALSQGRYTWKHNRVLQDLALVISTAKGEIHPFSTSSIVFTPEGGIKKWLEGSITINTHRKGLLDGCDDWVVSADLPEWERHPDVIRKTALRPDIVIHSASTQQIIMVELTVPYESRMEEAHAFKEGKYLHLTKELKKDGYESKVMPVEFSARGFVGSLAYGLLSKPSIGGNKRTKVLRLLTKTAENSSRWIWSRRNESALNDCLLRQEGQPADLGLTLTAQSVCERFYGNTSFPCRNFDNFTEICTILRCRTLEDAVCILVVPPTGTCCGDQMQCDAGTCVDAPQGECPTDEECPLGDQPSIPLESSSTTCDQLSPAFCYIDEVRNYCCDTCRSHRTNNLNCTYGDRKDCSAVTDASRCFDQTLATDCCGTCARLTASPITMPTTSTTPSAGPPSTEAITTSTASPTTQAATTNDGPPVDSTNTASLTTADPNTNTVVSRPRTTPSTSTTNQRMTLATQVTTKRESQNGDRPQNGYGYKPDGFEGCYLPPCSAHALFQKIVVSAIILVCLCLVRKIVDM